MKQNKPMTPREEFEKLFEHVAYELDGNKYLALNLNLNPDEIWNWHISEMEKLLERVEKEVIGEDKETYQGTDVFVMRKDLRQSLNKLKEQLK